MSARAPVVTLVMDAELWERVNERRGSMPVEEWLLKVARESSRRPNELRANFGSLEHKYPPEKAGPTRDAGRCGGEQRSDRSPPPVPERVRAVLGVGVVLEGVRREDGAIEFFTASRSDQGLLRPSAAADTGSLSDDPGDAEKGSDSGGRESAAGSPSVC